MRNISLEGKKLRIVLLLIFCLTISTFAIASDTQYLIQAEMDSGKCRNLCTNGSCLAMYCGEDNCCHIWETYSFEFSSIEEALKWLSANDRLIRNPKLFKVKKMEIERSTVEKERIIPSRTEKEIIPEWRLVE